MKNIDKNHAEVLLTIGLSLVKNGDKNFVAYNSRFLGYSQTDKYGIYCANLEDYYFLNEFCFGYTGTGTLQIIDIYKTKKGMKYGLAEVSMSVYAFWEIIE